MLLHCFENLWGLDFFVIKEEANSMRFLQGLGFVAAATTSVVDFVSIDCLFTSLDLSSKFNVMPLSLFYVYV